MVRSTGDTGGRGLCSIITHFSSCPVSNVSFHNMHINQKYMHAFYVSLIFCMFFSHGHCLFVQAYENYSFEELRFASPTPKRFKDLLVIFILQSTFKCKNRFQVQFVCFLLRPSENMLIRANTDGTYSANWTPGAVGLYTIHVTIDGIEIGNWILVFIKALY